jgi:hypothetical protein
MTDIDFDELDRAVNSLMNKQQEAKASAEAKTEAEPDVLTSAQPVQPDPPVSVANTSFTPPVTSAPVAPVATPAPTPAAPASKTESEPSLTPASAPTPHPVEDSQPVASSSVLASPPEPTPIISRTAGLAAKDIKSSPAITRRPTGRFMDVVRPSSTAANPKSAAPMPSRTGVSLQPSADLVDVVNMNGKSLATGEDSQDIDTQSDNLDNTPDLKDIEQSESAFAAIENAPIEELANDSAAEEHSLTNKIAQSLAANNKSDVPVAAPLESPFIANVEVEKRPLGAANRMTENSETISEEDDAETTGTEEMKLEHQYNTGLADYSTDKEIISDAPDSLNDLNPEIIAIEEAGIPESPETEKESGNNSSAKTPSAGGTSSEVQDVDPEPAPMFAAASMEVKPSSDKEKKKSGALTALLIVLFLAIGVAGGAVSYFLLIK